MQIVAPTLLMTAVFMLTSIAEANDPHFQKAQKFFYESQQQQKSGVPSQAPVIKGHASRNLQSQGGLQPAQQQVQQQFGAPAYAKKTAVYLSFINEKYNDGASAASPSLRTSLGLTIPILNAKGGKTRGEFSIISDIRNASEWGRVRFYHKESVSLIRWNDTQLELFAGAGLGYGYGDLVERKDRVFAPWMAGFFFNQIHKQQPVFYRFEFGFSGDIAFSGHAHSAGFFGNISLGYKL